MLLGGRFKNALVIGAEKLSSIMDFEDRTTCVLFGDGAGAVVLSKTDEADVGILGTLTRSDGSAANLLHMPAGGCATPATSESVDSRQHFLKMNGKEIFKVAVRLMEKVSIDLLEELNMTTEDIDCVVPHQANIRILDTLAGRLNIPTSKFFNNIERYGNTSAASIPIALDEAVRAGKINSGDHLFLVAFGAGLTWGSCVIKWK
jgi:3-oxoacyl-[acyl-carrier-protein] synthase-3